MVRFLKQFKFESLFTDNALLPYFTDGGVVVTMVAFSYKRILDDFVLVWNVVESPCIAGCSEQRTGRLHEQQACQHEQAVGWAKAPPSANCSHRESALTGQCGRYCFYFVFTGRLEPLE